MASYPALLLVWTGAVTLNHLLRRLHNELQDLRLAEFKVVPMQVGTTERLRGMIKLNASLLPALGL